MISADRICLSKHPATISRTVVLIADPEVIPTSPLTKRLVEMPKAIAKIFTQKSNRRR